MSESVALEVALDHTLQFILDEVRGDFRHNFLGDNASAVEVKRIGLQHHYLLH